MYRVRTLLLCSIYIRYVSSFDSFFSGQVLLSFAHPRPVHDHHRRVQERPPSLVGHAPRHEERVPPPVQDRPARQHPRLGEDGGPAPSVLTDVEGQAELAKEGAAAGDGAEATENEVQ